MGSMSYRDFYEHDLIAPKCCECSDEESLIFNKITGDLICENCATFTRVENTNEKETYDSLARERNK